MADIARIVDEIRGFLLSYDQSMKDSLVGLAREYSEACVDANKRLARCQRLLQQGLRVEALHLAREAPDLLDSIQALDFPERGAWTELVKTYDLAIPPEFDAVAIEFLQSAYVEDDPLKELLRGHRRLALMRAPLRQRIEILRQLAAKDANNPIWAVDIQAFETARVEQIKEEAAEAKRRQDVAGLGLLNDELSAKGWLIPLPKSIVRGVAQTLAQFRQNQAQQDMAGLVFSLHEAFAALDVDAGRQIRARWRQLEGKNGTSAENPFFKQVEPAFLWLEEADRQEEEENDYELSLADLDDGLIQGLRRTDLAQLHDAILRFGRGMPDELEVRYRARIADLDRASSRVTRMIIASVVVGVVVLGALALLTIWKLSDDATALSAARKVAPRSDPESIEKSRQFLENLEKNHVKLASRPEVVEARENLKRDEAKEEARAAEFEKALALALAAPLAPNESTALDEARKLALKEPERRRVTELAARRKSEYLESQVRAEAEARPRLRALSDKVDTLKAELDGNDPDEKLWARLREVTGELRKIRDLDGLLVDDVRSIRDDISRRADDVRDILKRRADWRELETDLVRATVRTPTSTTDYDSALASAIESVPFPEKAAAFRRVRAERACWGGALAWAELAHAWQLAPSASETPREGVVRADRCSAILQGYPALPDRPFVEEARDSFAAVGIRTEGVNNLRGQFNAYFSAFSIQDVYFAVFLDLEKPYRYYTKTPVGPGDRQIQVFLDFDEASLKNQILMGVTLLSSGKAPQSLLADDLKKRVKRDSTLEDWVPLMTGFLKRVATEESQLDPILKLSILRFLTRIAGEGSRPMAEAMAPTLSTLQAVGVPELTRWMNPKDPVVNQARERAKTALARLNDLSKLDGPIEAARRGFKARLDAVPQPVGCLVNDRGWTCRVKPGWPLPWSGALRVVAPGQALGLWKTIGRIKDGEPVIESPEQEGLLEGRLVFVVPDPARS